MRKVSFFLILALLIGFPAFFIAAQDQDAMAGHHPGSGYGRGQGGGMMGGGFGMMDMMGGGMMMGAGGGMMGSGMMGMMGMMEPGGMGLGMGLMGFDLFEWLKTELQLNDQQVSRLRDLWLEHVRSAAPARANLQIAQADLQNLLSARTVNMTQVETRIREMARLWGDMQLAQTRLLVQAKAVFTPEQLQRLRSLMGPGARGRMPGYDSRFEDERDDQQGAIPPRTGPGMMRPQQ